MVSEALAEWARRQADLMTAEDWEAGPDGWTCFGPEQREAVLAYLDEVWAGLTKAERGRLRNASESSPRWGHASRTHGRLLARGLVDAKPCATPLGRAVLKRAEDRGL